MLVFGRYRVLIHPRPIIPKTLRKVLTAFLCDAPYIDEFEFGK